MSKGPVKLFPTLYDISPFKAKEHPEHHPDSVAYLKYWEDHELRCIEGVWGHDTDGKNGGWRYMPGFLYYYYNFCIIELEDKVNNSTRIENPLLRDVEWMLSYGWLTARGFSGFMDDARYTSHRLVEIIEENDPKYDPEVLLRLAKGEPLPGDSIEKTALTPKQLILFRDTMHTLINPNTGNLKKYVEAREYLYMTHKEPLGKPLYLNDAVNFFVLGSRGFGKSYFCSNAVIGHEFKFYGKKYRDKEYREMRAKAEIFVGSALGSKSSDLLKKFASSEEWQKKNYGAWGEGDDFIPGYFSSNTSGSLAPNNAKSPYRHEYQYSEGGTWLKGGTGTRIQHGVYTTENPQAAVGTRPSVMVIEEVGLLGNLLEVHGANETCQIRDNKFGSSFYIGTGGNMEKITESKIVFEDPKAHNFLPYKDHWENRIKPIGFFLPAYYVDNDFKDENGNTDLQAAYDEEMYQRKIREGASTSSAIDQYQMARPIVPSEMFLSPTANIFPTAKLREREATVQSHDLFKIRASIGELEWGNNHKEVYWKEDIARRLKPITKLNLDSYKGDIGGAIVIYEHPPELIPNPTYTKSLYKVTYDPVKDDGGGTSLASILVYKGFVDGSWNGGLQDAIVAEYIGRLDRVKDIHEIALKLATYYNAKVMVENNIPDFIRYCKMKGFHNRLQISPYEAMSKAMKRPSNKYDFGVNMSKQLNVHCEQLVRQWFLEPWKMDESGKQLTTIDKIFSPRLLNEAIVYEREGNYDHISSLKLLALWLSQEREVPAQEVMDENVKEYRLDDFLKSRQRRLRNRQKMPFHAY